MAFQILNLQQQNLGIGMGWPYSNGEPKLKAEELEAQGFMILANEVNELVGIATEMPKKGPLYSLAALCLAYLEEGQREAAFVLQLDPNSAVFVGVVDGLPVGKYDNLISIEKAPEILDRFADDVRGNTEEELHVFTNMERFVGERDKSVELIVLEDLVNLLADRKTADMTRVRKMPVSYWPAALIGASVLAVAGFYGWGEYQDYKRLEDARREVASQKSPQQLYEESLPAAFSQAGWTLADTIRILNLLADKELTRAGWEVEKISCSIAKAGCTATWFRKGGATFATFYQATPTSQRAQLAHVQETIIEHIPFQTAPLTGWKPAELGDKSIVLNGPYSLLQRLSGTGDASVNYTQPQPYAVAPNAKVPNPVGQGSITFTSDIYLLPMLTQLDGRFLSVAEIAFAIESNGKATTSITFNYYSRQA